ncbi:MFS general substrate transporter [Clavulina sp. PMI_390]|nr:MFS general substrate transporter [Clavulina sp. PMI_390]
MLAPEAPFAEVLDVPAPVEDEILTSPISEAGSSPSDRKSSSETLAGDPERAQPEPIYVDWEPNDPENPFNWSRKKKWVVTFTACLITCLSASTGSIIAVGYPGMTASLHSSGETNALTLSMYALGFALAPLVLASFSEEFGRRPMYIVSSAVFTALYAGIAGATNIQTVIICRFLQGAAGSTGATMVGGTIADIWHTHERGLPMSSFSFCALFATGLGPVIAGWIEMSLGWRWIEWLAMIVNGILTLWLIVYGAQETRGSIILQKRVKRLRKETGDMRYRTKFDPPDMKALIWISVTRPLHLLFTELIVISFSTWLAFVWGCVYGLIQSIGLVFETLYGFNSGQIGLVFITIMAGTMLGALVNIYQERLFARYHAKKGPEARLYMAMVAGVTFVLGAFIYAWTSYPHVHWIAPCIGITIIMFSAFTIYLAVFNYLADSYLLYASSALAGQSLFRNVAASSFPLFTNQMYKRLGYQWASTLLALVGATLAPIPIVLYFLGPKIRARSHFAQSLSDKS